MTRAGVDQELVANHVRVHGMAVPLQASDLIYLQQQNVSKQVIEAMQMPPVQVAQPVGAVPVYPAPAPVVIEERWGPPYYYHYYHPRPRPVHWGLSFSN